MVQIQEGKKNEGTDLKQNKTPHKKTKANKIKPKDVSVY